MSARLHLCQWLQDRNNLSDLSDPRVMGPLMTLPSLTMLDFAANALTEIPRELGCATALR